MNYILDTNVLLLYIRKNKYTEKVDSVYAPLSMKNAAIISVVTVAEIKSLALQNN